MKAKTNNSRKFKTARSSGAVKTKRRAINSNLLTDYELMLKIYLLQKEQQQAKEGVKYPKVARSRKVEDTKTYSFSVWNNIAQVFTRANHLITNFSRPAIGMLWK